MLAVVFLPLQLLHPPQKGAFHCEQGTSLLDVRLRWRDGGWRGQVMPLDCTAHASEHGRAYTASVLHRSTNTARWAGAAWVSLPGYRVAIHSFSLSCSTASSTLLLCQPLYSKVLVLATAQPPHRQPCVPLTSSHRWPLLSPSPQLLRNTAQRPSSLPSCQRTPLSSSPSLSQITAPSMSRPQISLTRLHPPTFLPRVQCR
jgi:hypothetical protein